MAFGRAFVFVAECLAKGLKGDVRYMAVKQFATEMVNALPPPGELALEEGCFFFISLMGSKVLCI